MVSDKVKIRKYRDDLNVCGLSVIVLGVWSVVKAIIELFTEFKNDLNLEADTEAEKIFGVILVVLIFGGIAALIMWLHLYVGLNAMKAARSQSHKKGYFGVCIFLCVLTVASLGTYLEEFKDLGKIDTTLAALLVDLTTIYIFTVIIISTYKMRKLGAEQIDMEKVTENTVLEETETDDQMQE